MTMADGIGQIDHRLLTAYKATGLGAWGAPCSDVPDPRVVEVVDVAVVVAVAERDKHVLAINQQGISVRRV